jgi:hypothetical protein
MVQSSIFDIIKSNASRGTVPVPLTYKSTTAALIGKKVAVAWYEREVIATIDAMDTTYPETAYGMTWTKQDNPEERIPADCAGMSSNIHYSSIKRVLN